MRILVQNPYLQRGGAESRLRALLASLAGRPEVEELHLLVVEGERWPGGDPPPGLAIHPCAPARVADETGRLIDGRGIDLLQFHNEIEIGLGGLRVAQERGIPTLWVAHDYWPICGWRFGIDVERAEQVAPCEAVDEERCLPCVGPGPLRRTRDARATVDRCDLGGVPSGRGGALLAAGGVLPGRLRTVHPWIDLATFAGVPRVPRHPWRVLFVGNLWPHKGVGVVLEAWRMVERWLPAAELLIVAGEANWEEVDARVARLGLRNVLWHPPVPPDRLARLYASARVTVFPSIWEEVIGLVWLESLACGTPVIASAIGSIPELLTAGGVVVPPRDTDAWAGAIHDLLVTPARAAGLGAEGRARVVDDCEPTAAAERFADLYRELALTARSGPP